MIRKKGLYVLSADGYNGIYGAEDRVEIEKMIDIIGPPVPVESLRENPEALKDAEIILSGRGGPKLDAEFLRKAPLLKAFFYGGGSMENIITDEVWGRAIIVSSAYAANAIPVAEYTLASIIFSLKNFLRYANEVKEKKTFPPVGQVAGCYGSTVGIVSLGMVGRIVAEKLKSFDVKIIAYDPFFKKTEAERMNIKLVSLEELFSNSDVVSVHAPLLPETEGMIKGKHFETMKHGASFINTSKGAVVCESEMVELASRRGDIQFILDVTHPEPPEGASPLYSLPNVILTPHIAGSMGTECRRMGHYMVEELKRYLTGAPLKWQLTRDLLRNSSHSPSPGKN